MPINYFGFQLPSLFVDECQRQGKIVCQQSMRCADQDVRIHDDATTKELLVCQDKKFLCLNSSALCNGKFDCWPHDQTDEQNCEFKLLYLKNVLTFLKVPT